MLKLSIISLSEVANMKYITEAKEQSPVGHHAAGESDT